MEIEVQLCIQIITDEISTTNYQLNAKRKRIQQVPIGLGSRLQVPRSSFALLGAARRIWSFLFFVLSEIENFWICNLQIAHENCQIMWSLVLGIAVVEVAWGVDMWIMTIEVKADHVDAHDRLLEEAIGPYLWSKSQSTETSSLSSRRLVIFLVSAACFIDHPADTDNNSKRSEALNTFEAFSNHPQFNSHPELNSPIFYIIFYRDDKLRSKTSSKDTRTSPANS